MGFNFILEFKNVSEILSELEKNFNQDWHYNHSFKFKFENSCSNSPEFREALSIIFEKWEYSILYSLIYIGIVFLGQRLMKNYNRFHLYRSLIAWNILLAGFSILGTVRMMPHFLSMVYKKGVDHSICKFELEYGVVGWWTFAFPVSKLIDLVDTAFVILRKQKLIFLHWYHHAITLIFSWYIFKTMSSIGRWFVIMNLTVHSIMYTYYAFKAARFSIPKIVSIIITILQITQMIVGLWIIAYAIYKKTNGGSCDVPMEGLYFAVLIYFSFFVLFFNFFRNSYLKKQHTAVKVCAGLELDSSFLNKKEYNKAE